MLKLKSIILGGSILISVAITSCGGDESNPSLKLSVDDTSFSLDDIYVFYTSSGQSDLVPDGSGEPTHDYKEYYFSTVDWRTDPECGSVPSDPYFYITVHYPIGDELAGNYSMDYDATQTVSSRYAEFDVYYDNTGTYCSWSGGFWSGNENSASANGKFSIKQSDNGITINMNSKMWHQENDPEMGWIDLDDTSVKLYYSGEVINWL